MSWNNFFKNKLFVILIIVTLIAISSALVLFLPDKKTKESVLTNEAPNPQVQISEDYVKAVDRIFKEYSTGNTSNITSTAIEGLGDDKSGFQSIPKEYFTGTFELKNIKNGVAGGKEMLITFSTAPDKTFWVWVYQLSGGSYQIRGIQQNLSVPAE